MTNTAKDIFEAWSEWNQQSFEAVKKIAELNLALSEKLIKEQVELTNSLVELTAKNAESFGKAKDVQEAIATQTAATQECSKQILKSYRSCSDLLASARKAYSDLCETNLKAASNLNTAGKKTA